MTIYCRKCKGILNKHQTSRCPECGEPTEKQPPVPAEPRYLDSECGGGGCRLTPATEPESLATWYARMQTEASADAEKRFGLPPGSTKPGNFTPDQMIAAIDQWLAFGERMLATGQQAGYFSGSGWAARALDAARDFIQKAGAK
jgi:hypothetical protein